MRRDFSTFPYKYQGMEKEHKEYLRYLEWLDKLLENEIQSMDQFSSDFIQFGLSRLWGIKDKEIQVTDLIGYRPRLLGIIWFYGKIE